MEKRNSLLRKILKIFRRFANKTAPLLYTGSFYIFFLPVDPHPLVLSVLFLDEFSVSGFNPGVYFFFWLAAATQPIRPYLNFKSDITRIETSGCGGGRWRGMFWIAARIPRNTLENWSIILDYRIIFIQENCNFYFYLERNGLYKSRQLITIVRYVSEMLVNLAIKMASDVSFSTWR